MLRAVESPGASGSMAFTAVACLSGPGQSPRTVCTRRSALRIAGLAMLGLITSAGNPVRVAAKSLEYPELRGLGEKSGSDEPAFRVLLPGVKVQEISSGEGAEVVPGSKVSVHYVLRRSNGYFVDASYGFDRFDTYSFTAGTDDVISGFDAGIRGMRPGGRRRIIVGPEVGYTRGTSKTSPGPIPPDWGNRRALSAHASETLLFEVQVVRVR